MKELKTLKKAEYVKLKDLGLLSVIYPEATGDYTEDLEEESFKVGDWVCILKGKSNLVANQYINKICQITKLTGYLDNPKRYSVDIPHNNDGNLYVDKRNIKLATLEEIEEHLLSEAKRLYPVGTKYKSPWGTNGVVRNGVFLYTKNGQLSITDNLPNGNFLYKDGKWAEIIKEDVIKIAEYEAEYSRNGLTLGCRTFSLDMLEAYKLMMDAEALVSGSFELIIHQDKIDLEQEDKVVSSVSKEQLQKIIERVKNER